MIKVAFSPDDVVDTIESQFGDEVMTSEYDLPQNEVVIAEEPAAKPAKSQFFDWENNKDFKIFLVYLNDRIKKIPPHSGQTTVGCERAIKYLKLLDNEISKAFADDMDCNIDEKDAEKLRRQIRDMVKKLDQRHKQINESYANDGAYASVNSALKKEAQDSQFTCSECHRVFATKDALTTHLIAEHNMGYSDDGMTDDDDDGLYEPSDEDVIIDDGEFDSELPLTETAPKADKLNHLLFNTDFPLDRIDELLAQAKCNKCKTKLIVANDNIDLECLKCGQVYVNDIKKTASRHPNMTIVLTPFERAIASTIINAKVSNGKDAEKVYTTLKEKYAFTDREELSIHQVLCDMGYPILKDRGLLGQEDKNTSGGGVELATNYWS